MLTIFIPNADLLGNTSLDLRFQRPDNVFSYLTGIHCPWSPNHLSFDEEHTVVTLCPVSKPLLCVSQISWWSLDCYKDEVKAGSPQFLGYLKQLCLMSSMEKQVLENRCC